MIPRWAWPALGGACLLIIIIGATCSRGKPPSNGSGTRTPSPSIILYSVTDTIRVASGELSRPYQVPERDFQLKIARGEALVLFSNGKSCILRPVVGTVVDIGNVSGSFQVCALGGKEAVVSVHKGKKL